MTHGWHKIEEVAPPNDVFDVIAQYYDAKLDRILFRRFIDCVQVEGEIFISGDGNRSVSLVDNGFRPIWWHSLPDVPDEVRVLRKP